MHDNHGSLFPEPPPMPGQSGAYATPGTHTRPQDSGTTVDAPTAHGSPGAATAFGGTATFGAATGGSTSWAGFALPPDAVPGPPAATAQSPAPSVPYGTAPTTSSPVLLVVGAVVLALVLGIGGTLLAVQPWSSADAQASPGGTGQAEPPARAGAGGYTAPAPTPSLSSGSSDPSTQLVETARSDDASIDSTVGEGRWVPQISSKYVGLQADGITYDAAAIWQDHYSLRSRYGGMLLNSTDYATFSTPGSIWVTVVPSEATNSPDQANAWCDRQGLAADDCFAKRLGHSNYEDTTRHRS